MTTSLLWRSVRLPLRFGQSPSICPCTGPIFQHFCEVSNPINKSTILDGLTLLISILSYRLIWSYNSFGTEMWWRGKTNNTGWHHIKNIYSYPSNQSVSQTFLKLSSNQSVSQTVFGSATACPCNTPYHNIIVIKHSATIRWLRQTKHPLVNCPLEQTTINDEKSIPN